MTSDFPVDGPISWVRSMLRTKARRSSERDGSSRAEPRGLRWAGGCGAVPWGGMGWRGAGAVFHGAVIGRLDGPD